MVPIRLIVPTEEKEDKNTNKKQSSSRLLCSRLLIFRFSNSGKTLELISRSPGMETNPSEMEKQNRISSFLEIAVGQSADIAVQFLQATSWNLDEAVQLFFVGSEGGGVLAPPSSSPAIHPPPARGRDSVAANESAAPEVGEDGVRAPLPAKRDTLYGDPSFPWVLPNDPRLLPSDLRLLPLAASRNSEETRQPAVWESDQPSASTTNGSTSSDNLASLYRPPYSLMYNGPFDKAKIDASLQDKWLIVNLQSTEEFSSHMLNRDTWSNEAVAQTIRTNFIFWQVNHDSSEGKKVCTYYNLSSIPAVLLIDPITGQKMRAWHGMVQPERLLEDLLQYMEGGPKSHHVTPPHKRPRESMDNSAVKIPERPSEEEDEEVLRALAASMEDVKDSTKSPAIDAEQPATENEVETSTNGKPSYPPLPEEPKADKTLMCRVGIRLPDGRRIQRNFLRTDPIKLLWSFCSTQVEDGVTRPFRFRQAVTEISKSLDFESDLTFDAAGLSNSMIFLIWD